MLGSQTTPHRPPALARASQVVALSFILAILVIWLLEALIYAHHYRVRCACPKLASRSFRRLGFLMRASKSPILPLYRLLFALVGLALFLQQLLLVALQYFHTGWMFNRHVAQTQGHA